MLRVVGELTQTTVTHDALEVPLFAKVPNKRQVIEALQQLQKIAGNKPQAAEALDILNRFVHTR